MKPVLFAVCLFCTTAALAQKPEGIYINTKKAPREIDSLYLNKDSTYRFAYFFPQDGVTEWSKGTWKLKGNEIWLFQQHETTSVPAFKIGMTIGSNDVRQLYVLRKSRLKYNKGMRLFKAE